MQVIQPRRTKKGNESLGISDANRLALQGFPGQIQQLLLSDAFFLRDCVSEMTNLVENLKNMITLFDLGEGFDVRTTLQLVWVTYFEELKQMVQRIPEVIQDLCKETLGSISSKLAEATGSNKSVSSIYRFLSAEFSQKLKSEFSRHNKYHQTYLNKVRNPVLDQTNLTNEDFMKLLAQRYQPKITKFRQKDPEVFSSISGSAKTEIERVALDDKELARIRKEERLALQQSIFKNSMYSGGAGASFLGAEPEGGNVFESVLIGLNLGSDYKQKQKFNAIKEGQFKSQMFSVNPVQQNESIIKLLKKNHQTNGGKKEPLIQSIRLDQNHKKKVAVKQDVRIASLPDEGEILFFGTTFGLDTIKIEKNRKINSPFLLFFILSAFLIF